MKTNAIIRIAIWSLVIVLLVGILIAGIGWGNRRWYHRNEVQATEASSTTHSLERPATVSADILEIHSTPAMDSRVVGELMAGEDILLQKVETVAGIRWGLIEEPVQGWIDLSEVEIGEAPADANAIGYDSFDADLVRDLKIVWACGTVQILPQDREDISVKVTGDDSAEGSIVCDRSGSQLTIWDSRIQKSSFSVFNGINISGLQSLHLTVHVPADWLGRDLKLEAASADIFVEALTFREVNLDTASGEARFTNCAVDTLDIDTASGDITYSGTLEELDCDAASASFRGELTNTPRSIDMDSASGSLDLTLPEDCGFTVKLDSMSGHFSSDFDTVIQNKRHVHGNGACEIDVDAMSGDVRIRKASGTLACEIVPPACTDPNCTDASHGHASSDCTLPDCTDPAHNHHGHENGHE